jgi:hypothetical protein
MPVKGYDKLYQEVDKMLQTDRVMIPAMNAVLAEQKKRIFQSGKAADESRIGTYSEKPISISKKNQSRNTGRTHFPKGYRQYKSLTGKGSSFVNLRNTDQMMFDLGTHKLSQNEYSIGFTNDFNADKAKWMEDKYDKAIFPTTAGEDNLAMRIVQIELNKID